ncbi:NAD(P)/FAD-dependent oxidoreductase [Kineosporia sp. J2-2]|uniref:Pyridine nucleotide-disulfide oxidoreductase domain-containing protein 2 n=1 Tax=Kineosporia corallincola TaxID=2835133 RepID=A0ABS5TNV7_9ACTN|nr:NAD(P)/FAD-dependent oxidoreductase [Kineosporia corallincola]MBT0772788.1 NAD(P)/FAD-dependent oxidoreductase [Kineosporia corallincola]
METVDAVVIGAGPNGLVGAAALADAGWDVLVLEAQDEVGGAVRSGSLWPESPDVTSDLFSAFYPLAAASPVIRRLELEKHGLTWVQAPSVIAHVATPDEDDCAVVHRDPADTAAALDRDHAGDGDSWLKLFEQWQRLRDPLLEALFTPFPPVRSGAKLLWRAGAHDTLDLARIAAAPVIRLTQEWFGGEHGRLLVSGNAMHADVPMEAPGSGLFGWLLVMLAQDVGFPVPQGGAGMLSQAMARRAQAAGARIDTGENVTDVVVRGGRATAVRTATGREVGVRRVVLADVDAPRLFNDLVGPEHLPARLRADLGRFEWDLPTVKVNWLVDGGIPWRAQAARTAGTVHFGTDLSGLSRWSSDLAANRAPDEVFALLGQMTTADPARSPEGTESVWAYTHLPRDRHDDAHAGKVADRLDETLERMAPSFRERVRHRTVQHPGDLEAADGNLHHGAINGGTAQLHQQLVFRPATGLGRPETVIDGLYLASAATHPGGGVHGACGWIAARSALAAEGRLGRPVKAARKGAMKVLYRG